MYNLENENLKNKPRSIHFGYFDTDGIFWKGKKWHYVCFQPYDLSFISDVRLPDLFSGVAKETVKMRDCLLDKQDETEELNDYEKHMKWFNECSKENFVKWYKSKEDLCESEKKVHIDGLVKIFIFFCLM